MTGARTVLKDERADGEGSTVLVALANPDHVDQLLRTATDLAAGGEAVARQAVPPVVIAKRGREGPLLGSLFER